MHASQLVSLVVNGGRLAIPPRNELPGLDTPTFAGLDDYIALMRCVAYRWAGGSSAASEPGLPLATNRTNTVHPSPCCLPPSPMQAVLGAEPVRPAAL